MGLEVGELYAKLVLDKTKFERDLKHSEHAAHGWGSRVGSSIGRAAKVIVSALAVAGAAFIALGIAGIEHAEVQERADRRVNAAFGKSAHVIEAWARSAASSLGVHDDALEVAIAKYAIWAHNVGKSAKSAEADGKALAKRASEIALATGASFDDVFTGLMKGEQGATRGLKGYGVAVSVSSIKAEALRLGLYKGTGALSDQAKAAALHSIIMKQTAKYTGIFADMQDTLALKQKKVGVIFDEVMDTIGRVFIEAASAMADTLLPAFQAFGDWVQTSMPGIQKVVSAVFEGIGAVLGPLIDLVQTVMFAIANGLNEGSVASEAFMEGPFGGLGKVVSDLVHVISGFLSEGDNLKYFLEALGTVVAIAVVPPMLAWAAATLVALAPVIAIIAGLTLLIKWLSETGVGAQIVAGATKFLGDAFAFVSSTVLPALGSAFAFITGTIIPDLTAGFGVVADTVLPYLQAAFDIITGTVLPAVSAGFDWITTNVLPPLISVFQTITDVIVPALVAVFQGAVDWVSQNLPIIGDIFTMVAGFVGEAVHAIATLFAAAFGQIAQVIKEVAPLIVAVGSVIFPALGTAATILLNVISYVFSTIGQIWDLAWKTARDITGGIASAFDALGKVLGAIMNGIVGQVKTAINTIIALVNGMIAGLNGIQIHVPAIGVGPVQSPAFDWNGLGLGQIPYLAKGTPNFRGGWAVLGERGPELAKLPAGTSVYDSQRSASMMDGAPLIGEQNIYGVHPDEVERQTRRAMRRTQLEWSLRTR